MNGIIIRTDTPASFRSLRVLISVVFLESNVNLGLLSWLGSEAVSESST